MILESCMELKDKEIRSKQVKKEDHKDKENKEKPAVERRDGKSDCNRKLHEAEKKDKDKDKEIRSVQMKKEIMNITRTKRDLWLQEEMVKVIILESCMKLKEKIKLKR